MTEVLSDPQWQQYERDGYLCIPESLEPEALLAMQRRIDEIMLGKASVPYDYLMMQLDTATGRYEDLGGQTNGFKEATLDYRKIEGLEHDDVFLSFMQCPLFGDAAARVYGRGNAISCYRAMFMNKPAGKGTILPWHQDDGESWDLDRSPLLTVWLALDPATIANGCVQVVPGSHKLGLLSRAGHTITPEQERELCPPEKIVHLELKAGEMVLLHNWLLHRSDVNRTSMPRRAFSVCYLDGRTHSVSGKRALPIVFGQGAMAPHGASAA